jgi:hypothetical protein
MMTVKSFVAALAITTAGLGFSGFAEAGQKFKNAEKKPDIHKPHHSNHGHHGHHAAAGLFGFAAGAIVGSAMAQQQHPEVVYVQPGNDWVAYCFSKYRSYTRPPTSMSAMTATTISAVELRTPDRAGRILPGVVRLPYCPALCGTVGYGHLEVQLKPGLP